MSDVQGRHAVVVGAGLERCLAVLLDYERYPDWYDTLDRVEVVGTGESTQHLRCVADAGPLGSVEFELAMRYDPPRLSGEQTGGNGRVEGVRMQWTLEMLAPEVTAVAYEFSASGGGRAARLALRAARPLVERDLVRAPAEALKRRVEGGLPGGIG